MTTLSTAVIALWLILSANAAPPQQCDDTTLPLQCRLFDGTHNNFGCLVQDSSPDEPTTGLVMPELDGRGMPRLHPDTARDTRHRHCLSDDFDDWFRPPSPQNDTRATHRNHTLNCTRNHCGHAHLYPGVPRDRDHGRDYFACHAERCFQYEGGADATLTVQTDMDLWLFIDQRLVLDLGGLHALATVTLPLASLGLTVNHTHRLDIFMAQRYRNFGQFDITEQGFCFTECARHTRASLPMQCHLFNDQHDNFGCLPDERHTVTAGIVSSVLPLRLNGSRHDHCLSDDAHFDQWFGRGTRRTWNGTARQIWPGRGRDAARGWVYFSCATHRCFVYNASRDNTFVVTTDCDLWLFVDGRLVIDLGGLHKEVTASASLGALGLTDGQLYTVDLYVAQRYKHRGELLIDEWLQWSECPAVPTSTPSVESAPRIPGRLCDDDDDDDDDTRRPTRQPTQKPTRAPSAAPTASPTSPTRSPTPLPTVAPSTAPTGVPTKSPTAEPTVAPTGAPLDTVSPTPPTVAPTAAPSNGASDAPTMAPSEGVPTQAPSTGVPTGMPTPSDAPTQVPLDTPTEQPTQTPTTAPSDGAPTQVPTVAPSEGTPTQVPLDTPSVTPSSGAPSNAPTGTPTVSPSDVPTQVPLATPTVVPTMAPSSDTPTVAPTSMPLGTPTGVPTGVPTSGIPTEQPTPPGAPTQVPLDTPSIAPTQTPSDAPTVAPTAAPSSGTPTIAPSLVPLGTPSDVPTSVPTSPPSTGVPTEQPTPPGVPTQVPTMTPPSGAPSPGAPTPSDVPTQIPLGTPTVVPTTAPSSDAPTSVSPSIAPSPGAPTQIPLGTPTVAPSGEAPSNVPIGVPTAVPTSAPTSVPPSPCCGNGIVEPDEECDNGAENHNPCGNCTCQCRRPRCGDGIVHRCCNDCPSCEECEHDEECDDGNWDNGDGCSSDCRYECRDGYVVGTASLNVDLPSRLAKLQCGHLLCMRPPLDKWQANDGEFTLLYWIEHYCQCHT